METEYDYYFGSKRIRYNFKFNINWTMVFLVIIIVIILGAFGLFLKSLL
jgi:hypothetical protein